MEVYRQRLRPRSPGSMFTAEVADLVCAGDVDTLKRWKKRGKLRLAPPGRHGQGRANQCQWDRQAVVEALALAIVYEMDRVYPPLQPLRIVDSSSVHGDTGAR